MFVEQRLYTFAPGKGGEFDRVYQAEGRRVQERYLGAPIGYYYSEIGMLNQVTTLWAYETLNDRVERRTGCSRSVAFLPGPSSPGDTGNPHPEASDILRGSAQTIVGIQENAMTIHPRDMAWRLRAGCAGHNGTLAHRFPSRPIRMLVLFAPGRHRHHGANNSPEPSTVLGQQVVVQNQGGAGALATDAVAKSEPDGYTLLYQPTSVRARRRHPEAAV